MKKILSHGVIYAVGNAANSAALLLLVPYLIKVLPTAEYGAWAIFEIVIFLLTMLNTAGLEVGLMREYYFQRDEQQRARLAGTIFLMISVLGMLITLIGTGIVISGIDFGLPGAPFTLLTVLGIGWSDALCTFFLTLFRIREQPFTFIAVSVGRMGLFTALTIAFVEAGFGLIGALGGRLIATLVCVMIAAFIARQWIAWHPERKIMNQIIRYGLPLLPTNLAAYILFAADRYVMKSFLTLEDIAVYTFAYKIAATLDVLITRPFALDWAPRRFKIATQPNPEQKYVQALLIYLWTAISFALVVVALTPLLYTLVAPPAYQTAIAIVPTILLAYIIYGLSYPLNIGIMLKDRTRDLPVIGWIAALSYIGLCWWWIPAFGLAGAAWATVVAYMLWTGCITITSLHLYPIAYPWRQIGLIVSMAAIAYGGLWLSEMWLSPTHLMVAGLRLTWVSALMIGCEWWVWYRRHTPYPKRIDSPVIGE